MDDLELRHDGALINALTGLGTSRDRIRQTQLVAPDLLNQYDAEALYQDWLPRRVVDLVANECTRAGWNLTLGGSDTAVQRSQRVIRDVEQWWEDRGWDRLLNEALKLSRLYGGAAIVMAIDDGQEADQPVDLKRIRSIRGLYPLERYRVFPLTGDRLVTDLSRPAYYGITYSRAADRLTAMSEQGQVFRVHPSRVLRFDGAYLPWRVRQANQGWGASALQPLMDAYTAYQTGIHGAAQILDSFDLFVHKMKGLGAMVAAGRESDLRTRLVANSMSRSVFGGLCIDADGEDVSFVSRTVGGVSDVLDRLRGEIQGATNIPHTLLFGDSPSGMGASGRSEERDFAKTCSQYQQEHLYKPLRRLVQLLMLSADGPTRGKEPDAWDVRFADLYVPYPDEVAQLRSQIASTDVQYITAGVVTAEEVAQARFGGTEWSMELTLDRDDKAPNHVDASQQSNLLQALKAINAGEIPIDTGVQLVMLLLGITQAEAKRIVASAGEAVKKQMEEMDQQGGGGAMPQISDAGATAPEAEPAAEAEGGPPELADEAPDTEPAGGGLPNLDSAITDLVRHSGVTVAVQEDRNGIRRGTLAGPSGQRLDAALDWVAIAGDGPKAFRVDWVEGGSAWILGCKTRATARGALQRLGADLQAAITPLDPLELSAWGD